MRLFRPVFALLPAARTASVLAAAGAALALGGCAFP